MGKHVIHIYGASGAGTSTLGRAVCDAWDFTFLDTDDYFWMPTDPPYTVKRNAVERVSLLQRELECAGNVVLSGSLVDWGDALIPLFTLAIRLETETSLRIQRLKAREEAAFGSRVFPGGDMYQAHQEFLQWAASYDTGDIHMRSKAKHDGWQRQLPCKQLVLNGAESLSYNLEQIRQALTHSL